MGERVSGWVLLFRDVGFPALVAAFVLLRVDSVLVDLRDIARHQAVLLELLVDPACVSPRVLGSRGGRVKVGEVEAR